MLTLLLAGQVEVSFIDVSCNSRQCTHLNLTIQLIHKGGAEVYVMYWCNG